MARYKAIRNVFIVFLVSGFWHGANWTFIAWGGLHALLFIPSFVVGTNRKHLSDHDPAFGWFISPGDSIKILLTFTWVCIGWVFFRSASIAEAVQYLTHIFTWQPGDVLTINPYDNQPLGIEWLYLLALIVTEYALSIQKISLFSDKMVPRLVVDAALILCIITSIPIDSAQSFIYFQF